jgi:hypothetical protein
LDVSDTFQSEEKNMLTKHHLSDEHFNQAAMQAFLDLSRSYLNCCEQLADLGATVGRDNLSWWAKGGQHLSLPTGGATFFNWEAGLAQDWFAQSLGYILRLQEITVDTQSAVAEILRRHLVHPAVDVPDSWRSVVETLTRSQRQWAGMAAPGKGNGAYVN